MTTEDLVEQLSSVVTAQVHSSRNLSKSSAIHLTVLKKADPPLTGCVLAFSVICTGFSGGYFVQHRRPGGRNWGSNQLQKTTSFVDHLIECDLLSVCVNCARWMENFNLDLCKKFVWAELPSLLGRGNREGI